MLKITQEQSRVFESAALDDFKGRVLSHLQRFFPSRCRSLGEPAVKKLIQDGLDDSPRYGIDTELGICKYIMLLFLFGRDFQKRAPWDAAFQESQLRVDSDSKLDELYDALMVSAGSLRN